MLAAIYRFGTPHIRSWRHVLPGAAMATITWFLATLAYGWYVTHGQYTLVYGSLAATVATLVWLYITSLSVLIGAEFNAQIFPFDQAPATNHDPNEREILITSSERKHP